VTIVCAVTKKKVYKPAAFTVNWYQLWKCPFCDL